MHIFFCARHGPGAASRAAASPESRPDRTPAATLGVGQAAQSSRGRSVLQRQCQRRLVEAGCLQFPACGAAARGRQLQAR
eukprot:6946215-Prymnesium_polylepis.1